MKANERNVKGTRARRRGGHTRIYAIQFIVANFTARAIVLYEKSKVPVIKPPLSLSA